ncbi:DUF1080 domain-containing protein [Glaciecola siphonariae]|uniref:DUF1080 domain-containing protein n=1 Tax=Glaciecola siphonariae TaxID=521012 RepID=A0ABV9LYA5_9ALTE
MKHLRFFTQHTSVSTACIAACLVMFSSSPMADVTQAQIEESKKTEVWGPMPKKVEAMPGQAPSDAIVLFDGNGLDSWVDKDGNNPQWEDSPYALTVKPGTGYIFTKQSFCDVQMHIEWRATREEEKEGQNKANSGVFLQERYEIQVLDTYENKTYANGQAASVYKQFIPLVDASRPAEEWQSYDIIFTAPIFENDELVKPAYLTLLHNGVLVHNNIALKGQTEWIGEPKYYPHGCLPIKLQDHGSANSFRNIWVREI